MLLKLAYFNLWRNPRRTLLTLSALVVSAALLILALGIFSGMMADILSSATEQYRGHIVVSRPGYQSSRDLFLTFDQHSADWTLWQQPGISALAPRLRAFALLSGVEDSQPAELLGVDVDREPLVTRLLPAVQPVGGVAVSGRAWVGEQLARRLKVGVGDELVVMTQAADGSLANDLLTVAGLFNSGDTGRDRRLLLVELTWLQGLMVLPGRIHELAMRVERPLYAAQLARQLQEQLPTHAPAKGVALEVDDWGRLLPQMQEAIASYDVSRAILVLILYSAAALGVLNTFYMSVLERSYEFGMLLATGMRPRRLKNLILLESLLLGSLASLLALLFGGALTHYMAESGIDLSDSIGPITYAGGSLPPRLHAVHEVGNYLIPLAGLLLVSLVASYLPARRAARLQPADVLRGN
ncbi:MAG: ABC transporter permease [Desulfuromonadaceae bacterium]|nr:ABC transporter permease [Desulfuromonadaceae bacterium]